MGSYRPQEASVASMYSLSYDRKTYVESYGNLYKVGFSMDILYFMLLYSFPSKIICVIYDFKDI